MIVFLKKHRYEFFLFLLIVCYSLYFSYLTVERYQTMNASYYDLGIMDQTVYNTFRGRFLELTDPSGGSITRMAIHNDLLLALFAPFYFFHQGPETLLVLQSIIIALGAIPLYLLSKRISRSRPLSLSFSVAYLLYVPLERANIFDFHAVTSATTLLIFMVYFAVMSRYWASFLFFILSLCAKENVALTTGFFGILCIYQGIKNKIHSSVAFGRIVIMASILWFIVSLWVVIPFFRQSDHFALSRFAEFGKTPKEVIIGLITKPHVFGKYIFHFDTVRYLFFIFAPLAFLSWWSVLWIAVATPEFAINLLSNSGNMQNIFFHYTAVITPFVFISAIYGSQGLMKRFQWVTPPKISVLIFIATLIMSYFKGPLPFSREKEIYTSMPRQLSHIKLWKNTLKNENLIISATPKIAPYFTHRKTFYLFDKRYILADYVIIRKLDIARKYHPYELKEYKDIIEVYYTDLRDNTLFEKIFDSNGIEVYKKIIA